MIKLNRKYDFYIDAVPDSPLLKYPTLLFHTHVI